MPNKEMKNMPIKKLNTTALRERIDSDIAWLIRAKGRFQRLLDIKAPEVILVNERTCWDRLVADVRNILADGRITLNEVGNREWKGILEEYLGLPDMNVILPKIRKEYEEGRKRLIADLRKAGLPDADLGKLKQLGI